MNPSLAKALLADRQPGVQLLYGVATANNTVQIAGSTVAVELPALEPVISGDYVAVLAAGADRLILGSIATEWTAVTFQNSWSNSGGAEQPVQYRKVGDMVQVRGSMQGGSLSAVCFTMPAGFRPPSDVSAVVRCGAGVDLGLIDILASTGACTVFGADNSLCRILFQYSVAA